MAKSILQARRECYLCRKWYNVITARGLEEHHIFDGPRRAISEREGLKVYLCHAHHNEPPNGAHFNAGTMLELQRDAAAAYDKIHGAGACAALMGKSY